MEHHGGSQDHAFLFKIVETPRNALSRQIGEAVKISRRGGEGAILNAKGEYNRCHITRLTLGADDAPPGCKQNDGEGLESNNWIWSQGANWESRKTKQREQVDKEMSRILCKEPKFGGGGSKRPGGDPKLKGGRNKKRKFQLIDVNWGSKDVRDNMRIDCPIEGESSPPSLADEQQQGETQASEIPPPSLVVPEGVPPLLAETGSSQPSLEEAECSPSSLAGEQNEEQCVIVKRSCTRHNIDAKMTKLKKKVWTKNPKTGLYGYRTRTSVLWECPTKYNPASLRSEQSTLRGDTGDYLAANIREGNSEDY